ncbi:MAG: hypothetical protein K8R28_09660 [Desulfobacterales bacterium]|nr:hypothetical protein [Desulfobacterales bacterium]
MHNIHLNIPFVVLSTKVNKEGTTEKRFLTPFGTVDVTFRKISSAERQVPHLEIEVQSDIEYWASYDSMLTEFKTTLMYFVWEIVKNYFEPEGRCDFIEQFMRFKGVKVTLMAPCEDSSTEQRNHVFFLQ